MEILSTKKRTRRKSAEPLKELGNHPETGNPINIYNGPYGPYVKYQKVNASIPKDVNVEELTLEQAIKMIETKKTKKTRRKKF